MYTLYHNPRCSKSRAALVLLEDAAVDFEVKNYIEDGLTENEILHIKKLLGKEVIDFTRTKEEVFKLRELNLNSPEEELIQAIVEEPKLFERPILICGEKAVIGRPTENIETFLKDTK